MKPQFLQCMRLDKTARFITWCTLPGLTSCAAADRCSGRQPAIVVRSSWQETTGSADGWSGGYAKSQRDLFRGRQCGGLVLGSLNLERIGIPINLPAQFGEEKNSFRSRRSAARAASDGLNTGRVWSRASTALHHCRRGERMHKRNSCPGTHSDPTPS